MQPVQRLRPRLEGDPPTIRNARQTSELRRSMTRPAAAHGVVIRQRPVRPGVAFWQHAGARFAFPLPPRAGDGTAAPAADARRLRQIGGWAHTPRRPPV